MVVVGSFLETGLLTRGVNGGYVLHLFRFFVRVLPVVSSFRRSQMTRATILLVLVPPLTH